MLRTNNSPEQAPEKVSTPSQPSPRERAWSLRSESACCITFRLPFRRPFLFNNTLLCPVLSHLPKVRLFPAFSTHLPKVRRWGTATRTPVAAFPSPACSSHLPKVRHFPAFSAHLPKVRRCITALRTPVAAFPFPPDLPHLPKVRHFPAFSTHLPKVRRWGTALRTPVAAFPSPPDLPHLPKVRHFPAFSTHLPKARILRIPAELLYLRHGTLKHLRLTK